MATGKSGTLTWTSGSYSVRATWKEEYDIAENTSKVTISKLEAKTSAYSSVTYYPDGKIQINGKTVKTLNSQTPSGEVNITAKNTWFTISNTSCSLSDIAHNSDGTKSVNITLTGNRKSNFVFYTVSGGSGSGWNVSGSKAITLTTIARTSSFGTITGNTIGSDMTVNITRNSTSFTHQLWYKVGNSSWIDLGTGITTSKTFTINMDLCSQLPNSTSGTLQLCLRTYNGSTQIGSDVYKNVTVNIPSSVVPTLNTPTVTIDNSLNSTISEWGIYVVGYSKARIQATASGVYDSTISSYTISGGYSATINNETLDYTGDIFSSSGSKTFKIVAKDSRGRSSSSITTNSITVYGYNKPIINDFVISRDEETKSKIIAKMNWTYADIGENIATGQILYKEKNSSTWINYDGDVSNASEIILNTEFDTAKSYNFKLKVTDSLGNYAEAEYFISTMEVLMDFRSGGKGLAIGKVSEADNFEVALQSQFSNTVNFQNMTTSQQQNCEKKGTYVHSANGTSNASGYIHIARFTIKSSYANTPIVLHVLQRATFKSIYTIRFLNADSIDPSLQYFTYQGGRPGYLVKSDTSVWDLYLLKSEKYDSITISNIENARYLKDRVDIEWKNIQVSELPSDYVTSYNYDDEYLKNKLNQILGEAYTLTTSYTAGTSWTINSVSSYLIGNILRVYFSAKRSSTLNAGNITNETVLTYKITHNSKIKSLYNSTSVNGGTGGVISFYTTNDNVGTNDLTFDVKMTAASTNVTEADSYISLPVALNVDAYF